MQKTIEVNGLKVDVEIKSTKSLRSSVRIKNGKVVMNISRFLMGRKRKETVDRFLNWSSKRLSRVSNDFVLPEYCDGGVIATHNKLYKVNVVFERRSRTRVDSSEDGEIVVYVSSEKSISDVKLQDLVEKAIIKDQTAYLLETIDELNQLHFQERYNSCRFKRIKSRFGSCSSKRNLNLAYRLLFAPREVFRYVCVHELAHLKQMNHSKKFWDLVFSAMPNYKTHETWLKNNGFMLG
jgi:predicted metal-dependent hydrolase